MIFCSKVHDLTSLSKLSICRSWIARSRLVWWKWSPMFRNLSRSLRLSEFRTRPSTKLVWKVWEYWGRPTSLSHDVETQWWSSSDALESLRMARHRLETKYLFHLMNHSQTPKGLKDSRYFIKFHKDINKLLMNKPHVQFQWGIRSCLKAKCIFYFQQVKWARPRILEITGRLNAVLCFILLNI